ncbi:hypothetical protein SAMN04487934_10754 [Eubacterium ruminantium]|nr:hypothetical protein SAMN04487934_10754 [Eubacterium ruminantium]
MAKNCLLGGVIKFTVAAAAVSGICYLFRDDLKSSKTYQKYEVDEKINKARTAVKDKTATIKDKATALKEKAPWNKAVSDEEDDELDLIIGDEAADRDYVSIDAEDTSEAADKVEEAVDKAESIIDKIEEAAAAE